MTGPILQAYLSEQHIKTDVKENIDGLVKAVKLVTTYLTRKKVNTIPFILVALDPMVKDTDTVVLQVEEMIIKKWSAFNNSVTATQDKSTTYVRAVILEALYKLAKDDVNMAVLIWLTARDVIGHYRLGSEEIVISRFLQNLANQAEENGQAAWGISRNLQLNEFKGTDISIPTPKVVNVSKEDLTNSLLRASQHTAWARHSDGIGENPGNFNQHWASFFSSNAADGLAEEINSAFYQQTKSLSSFSESIKQGLDGYLAQILPFFEDLNTSFAGSITANNKRSELLWWKQSLYSRSQNTSYRSLDRLNAAVTMALDLAEQVEPFYPESVDYLLREAMKDIHGDQVEEERLLTDWLEDSSNNLHQDVQLAFSEYATEGDERKSLLSAWGSVVKSGKTTKFFTETGIDKKAKLTISDLAVWLFHGLQAQKLATVK